MNFPIMLNEMVDLQKYGQCPEKRHRMRQLMAIAVSYNFVKNKSIFMNECSSLICSRGIFQLLIWTISSKVIYFGNIKKKQNMQLKLNRKK